MTLEQLKEKCASGGESPCVDFKRAQYNLNNNKGKGEFIKDVLAFANSNLEEPSYIIIGVDDKTHKIIGIDDPIDDQFFQNIAKGKTNRQLQFFASWIDTAPEGGKKVQVIEIKPNPEGKLYYLTENLAPIPAFVIYRRQGTITKQIEPDELIDEAEERWRKQQCPTVDITWDSPNSTADSDELHCFDLIEVSKPPASSPKSICEQFNDPKLRNRILRQAQIKFLISDYNAGATDEEVTESIKYIFSIVHFSVTVRLDRKYRKAAFNATLHPCIDSGNIERVNHSRLWDVLLPGQLKGHPPMKRNFAEELGIRKLSNNTIQPGAACSHDVFLDGENRSGGVLYMTVTADNADAQSTSLRAHILRHTFELYRDTLRVIANTMKSREDYRKWVRFLRELSNDDDFSNPALGDCSIRAFAQKEFDYKVSLDSE